MFYIDNHNVLYWQYWKYLVIWQLKDKDLLSSSTGKAASVLYSCIVQWIKVCTYTCVVWFIQYLWTLICNYDRTTRRSFCCCLRCTYSVVYISCLGIIIYHTLQRLSSLWIITVSVPTARYYVYKWSCNSHIWSIKCESMMNLLLLVQRCVVGFFFLLVMHCHLKQLMKTDKTALFNNCDYIDE